MADRKSLRGARPPGIAALLVPHVKLAGLVLLAAAPILLIAALVPRTAVLPGVSLGAIGVAAIVALAAWSFGARRDGAIVTLWDIAGAFVLIGCAAAIFSEPENILRTFGNP